MYASVGVPLNINAESLQKIVFQSEYLNNV